MKKILFTLTALFVFIFSFGQFDEKQILSNNFEDISSFATADLNGDNNVDIIIGSPENEEISWLKNNGDGNFFKQNIIADSLGDLSCVFCFDMDNDGDIDVFSGSSSNNSIKWFENDGNAGSFVEHTIPNTEYANAISVSDFNNDNICEIVYTSSGRLFMLKNNGEGVYTRDTIKTLNYPLGTSRIITVDLNNNSYKDIVLSSSNNNEIYWFENDGNGNMNSGNIVANDIVSVYNISFEDIDLDGDIDLLSASTTNGQVSWHENINGQGLFTQHPLSPSVNGIWNARAGDVDNDGDIDIIAAAYIYGGNLVLYKNDGNQQFSEPEHILDGEQPNIKNLLISDLDNDSDIDIIISGQHNGLWSLTWLENINNTTFSYPKYLSPTKCATKTFVDLNNDNALDILISSSNSISWYKNTGQGNFPVKYHIHEEYLLLSSSVCSGDIDSDGNVDVLYFSLIDDYLYVIRNQGNGIFEEREQILHSSQTISKTLVLDLDNDGDMDIICRGFYGNLFSYINDGNENFSYANISGTYDAYTVIPKDMDGNSYTDFIIHSSTEDTIVCIFNEGDGTFSEQPIGNSSQVQVGDIDNDGDIDILGYSSEYNAISWYENTSYREYSVEQQLVPDGYDTRFILIDADLDTDLDIISVNNFDILYKENDNIEFNHFNIIDTSFSSSSMTIHSGDLDGDSDADIFFYSSDFENPTHNNTKLWWHKNHTYGSIYKSKGTFFLDQNQNSQKDTNEYGFSYSQLNLSSNALASYTNLNGNFWFALDTGHYVLTYTPIENWTLTTDSSEYHIHLTTEEPVADSLDFGFYPNNFITDINPELTASPSVCGSEANFWISYQNQGTTNPNGVVELILGDSITFVSSAIAPDSIIGQSIYWHFDSLNFFATGQIPLIIQMPDFNSMGDTLTSVLNIYTTDSTEQFFFTDTLSEELACSYDPNDKLVTPRGIGEEGIISKDETLEYTVRFQNTGNAEAINIKIRDQIDVNLDISSIEILASSHDVQAYIQQNRWLVFQFDSIMLPDSTSNELESHGFVKFSIRINEEVLPNTQIFNTAHIYFDYNPAVITNTVMNTIECYIAPEIPEIVQNGEILSVTSAEELQWFYNGVIIEGATENTYEVIEYGDYMVIAIDENDCFTESEVFTVTHIGVENRQVYNLSIYPNPTKNYIVIESDVESIVNCSIYSIDGQLKKQVELKKEGKIHKNIISTNGWSSGVYIIKATGFTKKLVVE
jgi:uncharacterized repeat protein (TIGR01451 family)